MTRRLPATMRWSACFVVALGIHVAGAAALLARWSDEATSAANTPVIMVDLSPVAASPTTTPNDVPPDTVERQFQTGDTQPVPDRPEEVVEKPDPETPVEVAKVEPEQDKPAEVKPEPVTQADLSILPPSRPVIEKSEEKPVEKKKEVKKKKPQRQASLASATSAADRRAERMAATQPSAAADGNAMPDWRARVAAVIARHKQYPSGAQSRGEQGVANVSFLVDGSGRVHNPRLQRSSGHRSLDSDAVDWVMRSQPLPAPPGGKSISVTLPLSYNLR
jgi:protein TonB